MKLPRAGGFVGVVAMLVVAAACSSSEDTDSAKTDPITLAKAAIARGDTTIDLNGDGSAQLAVVYDGSGGILRAAIDVDQDGVPDLTWDVSTTPRAFVESHKGFVLRQMLVTPDATDPTTVAVVDTDTPEDKTAAATRRSYTYAPTLATLTITVDLDTDRDGVFDNGTSMIMEPTAQQASTAMAVDQASCQDFPDLSAKLSDAIPAMIETAQTCLTKVSPLLRGFFNFTLVAAQFQVECHPQAESPGACAESPRVASPLLLLGSIVLRQPIPIYVYPLITDAAGCSSPAATLFHEVMHHVLGAHPNGNGQNDPSDPIWGCEDTCFGFPRPASPATCAACTSTIEGPNARCASFAASPPAPAGDGGAGGTCLLQNQPCTFDFSTPDGSTGGQLKNTASCTASIFTLPPLTDAVPQVAVSAMTGMDVPAGAISGGVKIAPGSVAVGMPLTADNTVEAFASYTNSDGTGSNCDSKNNTTTTLKFTTFDSTACVFHGTITYAGPCNTPDQSPQGPFTLTATF